METARGRLHKSVFHSGVAMPIRLEIEYEDADQPNAELLVHCYALVSVATGKIGANEVLETVVKLARLLDVFGNGVALMYEALRAGGYELAFDETQLELLNLIGKRFPSTRYSLPAIPAGRVSA